MDEWIDLSKISGLREKDIDERLHPVLDGRTVPNSLYAITGCHPNSGGLFNTTLMAAVVGANNKYYFENIIESEPEFAFIYRDGRFRATCQNSLQVAWDLRNERIQNNRLRKADENFIRNITLVD